jgi:hypothetical protein
MLMKNLGFFFWENLNLKASQSPNPMARFMYICTIKHLVHGRCYVCTLDTGYYQEEKYNAHKV